MIESSKYNREHYPRKCFWTQERETRVKLQIQPSNNWAEKYKIIIRSSAESMFSYL